MVFCLMKLSKTATGKAIEGHRETPQNVYLENEQPFITFKNLKWPRRLNLSYRKFKKQKVSLNVYRVLEGGIAH